MLFMSPKRCADSSWVVTAARPTARPLPHSQLSPTALDFDCNCLRSNAERKVFLKHDVVGATLEGEGQVRIWYCSPSHTTRGGHTKTRYSLQKSDRFEFPERQAAQRFVQETQAAVSWWGRKQPPRVVAIVNPVSGRGSGASIFSRQVLPVLRDAAGLVLEVHTTRHRGHATEIVARLDLQQVDLILYVGGDGTVFEGMQGLFSRPDWATASRVPFAPVPTGSGNGLAASVGVFDALSAAFSVCKGRCQPLDVASVLQGANRYYLLLSLTYGLMANLDIGTEHLRWMGEPRFTIGGLQEILAARTYPLRVAVWPEETPPPPLSPPHPPHPPFLPPSPHAPHAAHGGLGPPP
ncbi:ATP-NAD kinase-like domain-containing protein [Haematococcus lacustris]